MKKEASVVIVTVYQILFLGVQVYFFYLLTSTNKFQEEYKLILQCIAIGGCGGILYCLRGVYLNYCVFKQWSLDWLPWYFIRPIVSTICGGVSYLFLKAGLLVLEAKKETDATNLGFFCISIYSRNEC